MKEEIIKFLKNVGPRWHVRKINEVKEYVEYMDSLYPDVPRNQQIYLLFNDLSAPPVCAYSKCNNIPFFHSLKQGYKKTCSTSCQNSLAKETGEFDNILKKMQNTMTEKYGHAHSAHVPEIREKIAQTNLARYGSVNGVLNNPEIRKRARERLLTKETQQRFRQTLMDRYGVTSPSQMEGHYEKVVNTLIQKYGVTSPHLISDRQDEIRNNKIAKLEKMAPESLIIDVIKPTKEKLEKYPTSLDFILTKCINCEHEELISEGTFVYRSINLNLDSVCSKCADIKTGSIQEKQVYNFLLNYLCEDDIICNDRMLIHPYELDMYIPSKKLAIEYCGLYWHRETDSKDKNYHYNKMKMCRDNGVQLITIFEDEWIYKRELVERLIRHKLGFAERGPGARKLNISMIQSSVADTFLDNHHLQGRKPGNKTAVGAFDGEELVAVMVFSIDRNNQYMELSRFATDDKTYAGLASRMLKFYARQNDNPVIVSFADLRWSQGKLYKELGFIIEKEISPDYTYVYKNKRSHKSNFRKDRIQQSFGVDITNKTERELTEGLGIHRIWDCGKIKFVWKNKNLHQ